MKAPAAPLSYRERVAQEKRRIAMQMPSSDHAKEWSSTKSTRRIGLHGSDTLIVWDCQTGEQRYSFGIVSAEFSFREGLEATISVYSSGPKVATSKLRVGRDPVYIADEVFVCVDAVDPFNIDDQQRNTVNLVVYSSAGIFGYWPRGYVVGTESEYNSKFQGGK